MKNSAINRTCAVLVLILAASSVWATVYQERDEINRSFTLPAKARVEVSAINGSVDIKAIDGDTAIVEIERTARSRAELDALLDLAGKGVQELVKAQKQALGPMLEEAAIPPLRRLALGPASLDLADGRAG